MGLITFSERIPIFSSFQCIDTITAPTTQPAKAQITPTAESVQAKAQSWTFLWTTIRNKGRNFPSKHQAITNTSTSTTESSILSSNPSSLTSCSFPAVLMQQGTTLLEDSQSPRIHTTTWPEDCSSSTNQCSACCKAGTTCNRLLSVCLQWSKASSKRRNCLSRSTRYRLKIWTSSAICRRNTTKTLMKSSSIILSTGKYCSANNKSTTLTKSNKTKSSVMEWSKTSSSPQKSKTRLN